MTATRLTHPAGDDSGTLLLGRQDVTRMLPMPDCIDAIENAFARHARGGTIGPAVLATHVEGGGFHVKAAGLRGDARTRAVYAAKINANFPGNPRLLSLPTIQGVIGLFDAEDVRAQLADVVSTRRDVRRSEDEIVIFDSTGTALEDVAAALMVYERARQSGAGALVELSGSIGGHSRPELVHP